MDSQLSFQIKCSLCLSDFTDPVTLSCEHSFCRQCITGHMRDSPGPNSCPECRRPYSAEDLRPSRFLRNMTEIVRGHLTTERARTCTLLPQDATQVQEVALVCPEHDEKLKLFCEMDQKLVCVVCRDGAKHQGHQFKPVKEACQLIKGKVKGFLGFLVKENQDLDDMTQKQTSEITVTQMKSKFLSAQISEEFEKMHLFLKNKEEEIKKKLKTEEQEAVEAMSKNNSLINNRWMDGREMECIFQSSLEITQPDLFLQWWNEKGHPVTESMRAKDHVGPETRYKSRVKDLQVKPDSLFLGPVETHLQFFVWKEMLKAINLVPEIFSIKDPMDSYLKVSPGKRSVRQADRQSGYYKDYNPGVTSRESFRTGQHYWEFEVGEKLDWSVGVTSEEAKKKSKDGSANSSDVHFNLKNDKGYFVSTNGKEITVNLTRKPGKIGLYLDLGRKLVTFYDGDIMTQIIQVRYDSDLPCSLSLYPGIYHDGANTDPVTVCSYRL